MRPTLRTTAQRRAVPVADYTADDWGLCAMDPERRATQAARINERLSRKLSLTWQYDAAINRGLDIIAKSNVRRDHTSFVHPLPGEGKANEKALATLTRFVRQVWVLRGLHVPKETS